MWGAARNEAKPHFAVRATTTMSVPLAIYSAKGDLVRAQPWGRERASIVKLGWADDERLVVLLNDATVRLYPLSGDPAVFSLGEEVKDSGIHSAEIWPSGLAVLTKAANQFVPYTPEAIITTSGVTDSRWLKSRALEQLTPSSIKSCAAKPHPVLKRQGDNLVVALDLSLAEALTGIARVVKTLDVRNLKIASDKVLAHGQTMRFRGEGMPVSTSPGASGELVVNITVKFPAAVPEAKKDEIRRALAGL
ncbi:Vacuolar protein sorting-associated protein 16 [Blastocladiella emersonii ATCC 22665]|nr:Vacuolar protein sorting-associated protein 16 [Blastocladiella emersonii ATCC 22665]